MQKAESNYEVIKETTIEAAPVKSFFVSMLTRDIKLEDAILDLLDNCVDGILRSKKSVGEKPYEGFRAEIRIDENSFEIVDNCGGIPWDLHEYAFRMGRDPSREDAPKGTVGVFGIGMKRAIFKIGRQCVIETETEKNHYQVCIDPTWLLTEGSWKLPIRNLQPTNNPNGTSVRITELNDGIKEQFGEDAKRFLNDLERMVSTHYAYIIEKGFEVIINDKPIKPKVPKLAFEDVGLGDVAIHPYIYEATTDDGVEIFLAVGLTRPLPSEDEIKTGFDGPLYSAQDAGWTVLCNDRAVLFCDRTELTGWGEANVPRFHNQFIAISGIVEFRSEDPRNLPTTTTKRGIDASSPLYSQIKNKMRDGTKEFTSFTNRWKGKEAEIKEKIKSAKHLPLIEIKEKAEEIKEEKGFHKVSGTGLNGEQYKPRLPRPKTAETTLRTITFKKEMADIESVASYLQIPSADPSDVGEKCFDLILEDAKR